MSGNISFGTYRSKESSNFLEIKTETGGIHAGDQGENLKKTKGIEDEEAQQGEFLIYLVDDQQFSRSFLFSRDQYLSRMRVMNADGELIELRCFPFFSSLLDARSILLHAISAHRLDESAYQLAYVRWSDANMANKWKPDEEVISPCLPANIIVAELSF